MTTYKLLVFVASLMLPFTLKGQNEINELENAEAEIERLIHILHNDLQKNNITEKQTLNCDTVVNIRLHRGSPLFLYHCEWDSVYNKGIIDVVISEGKTVGFRSVINSEESSSTRLIVNTENKKLTAGYSKNPEGISNIGLTSQIDEQELELIVDNIRSFLSDLDEELQFILFDSSANATIDRIQKDNRFYQRAVLIDKSKKCNSIKTYFIDEGMM